MNCILIMCDTLQLGAEVLTKYQDCKRSLQFASEDDQIFLEFLLDLTVKVVDVMKCLGPVLLGDYASLSNLIHCESVRERQVKTSLSSCNASQASSLPSQATSHPFQAPSNPCSAVDAPCTPIQTTAPPITSPTAGSTIRHPSTAPKQGPSRTYKRKPELSRIYTNQRVQPKLPPIQVQPLDRNPSRKFVQKLPNFVRPLVSQQPEIGDSNHVSQQQIGEGNHVKCGAAPHQQPGRSLVVNTQTDMEVLSAELDTVLESLSAGVEQAVGAVGAGVVECPGSASMLGMRTFRQDEVRISVNPGSKERKPRRKRLYTRYKKYPDAALREAMMSVQDGSKTVAQASKEYHIPRQTLQYRLFKKGNSSVLPFQNTPLTDTLFLENYSGEVARDEATVREGQQVDIEQISLAQSVVDTYLELDIEQSVEDTNLELDIEQSVEQLVNWANDKTGTAPSSGGGAGAIQNQDSISDLNEVLAKIKQEIMTEGSEIL